MKRMTLISAICSVLAVMPGLLPAEDQPSHSSSRQTTPAAGTWAAGAGVGFANPLGDNDFDAEPTFEAYLEYFCTPHVSGRATLGFISFDGDEIPGLGNDDVDVTSLNANIIYQWEGGVVHPFVTGGIGIYNYDPDLDDSDLEPGINGGGGINVYLADRFALKFEALFHGVDSREPDSYLTGTVGARWLWGH